MHRHHDHDHDPHGTRGEAMQRNRKRLAITLALAGGYMIAEIIGGLWTGSLALLADAGHMAGDVAGLALSMFAIWIAARPPSPKRTYGYYRAEILAALVNGAALIAVSVYIFIEAFHRFRAPEPVKGEAMMLIAMGGLGVNLIGLFLLHGGRKDNLNLRGAWLHVLGDALGSVAAIAAGLAIYLFGDKANWVDPLASVAIAVLIIYSSWSLLVEAVAVLMESAPAGIDVDEVRSAMAEDEGVLGVHDLHIWSITSGLEALSAHVVIAEGHSHAKLLARLRIMLYERFGIDHTTIQIEPEEFDEPHTCP